MSGRRGAKVDAQHAAVRDGLRALGWTVEDYSHVGGGVPDLQISIGPALPFAPDKRARGVLNGGGFAVWVEVKSKGGELTDVQQERLWLRTRAPVIVAECVEDVIEGIAQLRAARKGR